MLQSTNSVLIHFTLKNPPKLTDLSSSDGTDVSTAKRVTRFLDLANGEPNIFGCCLTYQIEIPNPKEQTPTRAFTPSISKCLDIMEKMSKTVFYTHMAGTMYPSQKIPMPCVTIDPVHCIHSYDTEVGKVATLIPLCS